MLSIEELIFVLIIAWPIFTFARPIAVSFVPALDFERRRKAWLVLTVAAFLSPTFWILIAIAVPILVFIGRRDSNPTAVYLLLMHVIPPASQTITVGGATILPVDIFMLLSICVMVPAALRMQRTHDRPEPSNLRWIDLALLGYGVLNSFQYLQAEGVGRVLYPITFTDSIRRVIIFVLIAYVPYFVTSRSNANRRSIIDSIATYCLSCILLSSIAIFESLKSWLLYSEMPSRLGANSYLAEYLERGHSLRAMASSGHPLTLATILAIACPLWLYLQPHVYSSRARKITSILLIGGLFVTYSRGPWIGAAMACLAYVALRPRALSTIFKSAIGILCVGALLSLTPIGQKVINLMPFFGGQVDVGTLTYRERLLDRTETIIAQHPLIGDSRGLLQLEDLRQGEGIIDLVNVYIQVLLNDGCIGLALFFGYSLLCIVKANQIRRRLSETDPDLARLGAALIASLVGLYVTMAGGSLGNSERMYYVIGALVAAYVAMANQLAPTPFDQQPRREPFAKGAKLMIKNNPTAERLKSHRHTA